MSWQDVATAAMYVLFAILGAIVRTLWDAVREIEKNLPEVYVRRDDFKEHAQRVEAAVQRIIEKLDEKADK